MSRGGSSEEVLLITKYVKHKKSEGSLYMMGERMAWMASTKNTFTISHNYTDIRGKFLYSVTEYVIILSYQNTVVYELNIIVFIYYK